MLHRAERLKETLIEWRRDLHRHPELGFEEMRTSAFVQEQLRQLGVDRIQTMAQTGVVALLGGDKEGPTVMLRADMDALPIVDAKQTVYASTILGKAHLCGHDAHTTMLLGAARLLQEHGIPRGRVKLVFQPAEETLNGAKAMIAAGVMNEPRVDAAVALHVFPREPVGKIAACLDLSTAYTDFFDLYIDGKGGHAASPHQTIDAVAVAAQVVTALQQIASRMISPMSPVVVTIGKITGGYANNVIAPSVRLEGTVRTQDQTTHDRVQTLIEQIATGVCSGFGATCRLDYRIACPPVINDAGLVHLLEQTTKKLLGENAFSYLAPAMGGEDFSFYGAHVPSVFFRLGVRNEELGAVYPVHHPMFDMDEDALPIGAAMLAQLALDYLDGAAATQTQ